MTSIHRRTVNAVCLFYIETLLALGFSIWMSLTYFESKIEGLGMAFGVSATALSILIFLAILTIPPTPQVNKHLSFKKHFFDADCHKYRECTFLMYYCKHWFYVGIGLVVLSSTLNHIAPSPLSVVLAIAAILSFGRGLFTYLQGGK